MKYFILSALLFATLFTVGCDNTTKKKKGGDDGVQASYNPKVIYGDDNRLDFYQVTDPMMSMLSDSTVALMRSNQLTPIDGTTFKYNAPTFEHSFALCPSEPFREQPSAAFCSGFLVGKNLVATAGHCIRTTSDCSGTKFVFGFKVPAAGVYPAEVDASQIYSCSRIVHSIIEMSGKDFAIVELDRDVVDHAPLAVRRSGSLQTGDGVTVVGYPSGIPLKVSGGANVRSLATGYFVANLDTYGGNSGSAVFNTVSGEVEGILVRGETDFVSQGSCRVSNRCESEGCRGEDVTLIGETLDYVPPMTSDL